ncbi:hypothetical protein G7Y89_g9574 [Cudoniella acicularis]|uniref:Uncharacterized protein n=1 Tax=Cudoniella acicularis TaxID=354080 RepID=A0A8H4RI40_9HELO|nr:hypothetical protein G7Y89_g9574 [Cudoniella acicularis]
MWLREWMGHSIARSDGNISTACISTTANKPITKGFNIRQRIETNKKEIFVATLDRKSLGGVDTHFIRGWLRFRAVVTIMPTSSLAAPNPGLKRRMQRRAGEPKQRTYQGSSMIAKELKADSTTSSSSASSSGIQLSENWSGAAITSPPSGQTFNGVSGTVTAPTPSIPSGVTATDGEYAASIWVGIDGDTYSTAILQTGFDLSVSSSGAVTYQAWYEWYPDYAYDFDLDISAGDVISMYVNATTTTSGSATVENLTTGKSATKEITSTSALGGENAEWIVEDFEQNNALVAFANFRNVTFSNCVAATSSSSEGVSSATIMDIENTSDQVLTSVTSISDSSFKVAYTAASTTSSSSGSSISGTAGSGTGTGTGNRSGFENGGGEGSGKGAFSLIGFKRWALSLLPLS